MLAILQPPSLKFTSSLWNNFKSLLLSIRTSAPYYGYLNQRRVLFAGKRQALPRRLDSLFAIPRLKEEALLSARRARLANRPTL